MSTRSSGYSLPNTETRCPLTKCVYNVHDACPGPKRTRRNWDAECHALPVLYLLMRFRLEDNGVRVFHQDAAERVAMDRKRGGIHRTGWYWKKGKIQDGPYRSETAACEGARVYLYRIRASASDD